MTHAASGLLSFCLLILGVGPGWLGVFLDDKSERPRVSEVIPDSPAAKAGLRAGDCVVQVDGVVVATRDELVAKIGACQAGQRVRLDVDREGKRVQVLVRLGERPRESGVERTEPAPADRDGYPSDPPAPREESGGSGEAAPGARAPRGYLGAAIGSGDVGIEVARVLAGSPAQQHGLQAEDLLLRWNGEELGSLAHLDARMAASHPGDRVVLGVRRRGQEHDVQVVLGERSAAEATGAATRVTAATPLSTDLDAARARAEASNRPVLLLYGAAWDGGSQAQQRVLATAGLRSALTAFECVWVDNERHAAQLAARRIGELPAIEVERGGVVIWRHDGFIPAESLLAALHGLSASEPAPAASVPPMAAPADPLLAPPAPAVAAEPSPSVSGDAAVRRELEQLRREIEQLRALLEELRRTRAGGE